MSTGCKIDPGCVVWPVPDVLLCDPCINLDDPGHAEVWGAAWAAVTSFLYTQTGECWPGSCFHETLRPCLDRPSCPTTCSCNWCGIYNWLPLTGTCLPIVDLVEVWIGADACNPEDRLWVEGCGVRLEWGSGDPRLVIEDPGGCCGRWPRQDLCRPAGSPGTWHVTVRTGCDPPAHVLAGAVEMASEITKECVLTGCRVKGGATRLSFDGTTVDVDPERGVTLPARMLQKVLDDADKGQRVEGFGCPTPWQFHNVTGPVKVECCDCGPPCKKSGCGQCEPVVDPCVELLTAGGV